jgi:hypothetical protein
MRHRRRHRWPLIALLVVLVMLAGIGGGSYVAYGNIRGQAAHLQAQLTTHLQAGQTELEAGKASLKSANAKHDPALVGQAGVHFTTAKLHFMAARQLADSSQLLERLEGLPTVGEQARSRHTAVDGIAEVGIAISDAGVELATLDGQIIRPPGSGQQGRTLLTVLEQTRTSLVKVRADFARAQKAAAAVDVSVIPTGQQSAFIKVRDTIASALTGLDEFERFVPILTEVLGGNGARTYLIEQVNPAELRPGGGFIGTFSVLRADHGALKLVKSGDAKHILSEPRPWIGERGYVAPPGPLLQSVSPDQSWSFMDSNFFPDFPSNAKAAQLFAQPRLGMTIDGVLAIDYYTVAKLLDLTGPMSVPGIGTVNAANFVPQVIQYELVVTDETVHKAALSAVAGPLMERVANLPAERWPDLIAALSDLAANRHFQAYFNSDLVQKEIDAIGWSGTLKVAPDTDFMMEVESNMGATKANYFLTRNYTVELTRNGAMVHHKVTIDVTDDMPYIYRPSEYYYPYLRLYVSGNASGGSTNLRRVRYPNPPAPAGVAMIDGWIPLFHGYGHSAQAVFEYDTPWRVDARGLNKTYWQKQPGTLNDKINIVWNDGAGHTFRARGDLGQDRVIIISAKGVIITPGHAGKTPNLPNLSLG